MGFIFTHGFTRVVQPAAGLVSPLLGCRAGQPDGVLPVGRCAISPVVDG